MATVISEPKTQEVSGDDLELMEEIDGLTRESCDSMKKVVGFLVKLALPLEPWKPFEFGDSLRSGIENLGWPWNRAAWNYLDRKETKSAVAVWSAHYLALLSLQIRLGQRLHKSMPICNLGAAWANAGNKQLAVKCWSLGVVEDTLTRRSGASKETSYENLINSGVSDVILDHIILNVKLRFLNRHSLGPPIVPLFPEEVLDFWPPQIEPIVPKNTIERIKTSCVGSRRNILTFPI